MTETARQRIDKWLWYARVVKTRSMAAKLVESSRVRLNRIRITKPSHPVKPEDVLTIAVGGNVRVLKVLVMGTRRGPAAEARLLYEDLSPEPPVSGESHISDGGGPGQRAPGAGRPTKKERRELEAIKGASDWTRG